MDRLEDSLESVKEIEMEFVPGYSEIALIHALELLEIFRP